MTVIIFAQGTAAAEAAQAVAQGVDLASAGPWAVVIALLIRELVAAGKWYLEHRKVAASDELAASVYRKLSTFSEDIARLREVDRSLEDEIKNRRTGVTDMLEKQLRYAHDRGQEQSDKWTERLARVIEAAMVIIEEGSTSLQSSKEDQTQLREILIELREILIELKERLDDGGTEGNIA